jgi:hypothetical protein
MCTPSIADRLASTSPPWVHLLVTEDDSPPLPVSPEGFVARVVDGRRCRTKRALLDELARTFEFPAHFGGNWDALEDCLTDLGWLRGTGYRLEVHAADRLLARDPAGYATLVALLADVGRAWAMAATGHPGRSAVPFHTVLVVPRERLGARRSWIARRLAD